MRRFSGFLALIVLVAIGLGVVYYDRLWPDAAHGSTLAPPIATGPDTFAPHRTKETPMRARAPSTSGPAG